MGFHEIITNMSVLFGIYRFGIAGIFYGPLIVILYKFVEKELLMKELTKRPLQSVII
jgi:predicted PurR-regulated permease PerM